MRPQRKPAPEMYGELTFDDVQMVIVLRGEDFRLEWLQERFKITEDRAKHLALALLDEGTIKPHHFSFDVYRVATTIRDLAI